MLKKVEKNLKLSSDIRNRLTKKKILIYITIILLLSFLLQFGYKARIQWYNDNPFTEYYKNESIDTKKYYNLLSKESIKTTYRTSDSYLQGFSIFIKNKINNNDKIKIKAVYNGKNIVNKTIYLSNHEDKAFKDQENKNIKKITIKLPKYIKDTKNKNITIELINLSDKTLSISKMKTKVDENFICGEYTNPYLKILYLIFSIIVLLFFSLIYLLFIFKVSFEKKFFIVALLSGILFMVVFTPFSASDEPAHIYNSYRISNQFLRVQDTGIDKAIYVRNCDRFMDIKSRLYLSLDYYQELYENTFNHNPDTTLKLTYARANTGITQIFYYPSALGITVARLLNCGFIPMIFIGRLFNYLVVITLLYFSIKKIPFGKSIICVLALLPIALQNNPSFSYDGLIFGFCMLFISYCLSIYYSSNVISNKDIAVVILSGCMIMISKGLVYTPLLLLGLLVLKKQYKYLKRTQFYAILIGFVLLVGMAFYSYAPGILSMFISSQKGYATGHGGEQMRSIGSLILHPRGTLGYFNMSMFKNFGLYIHQLVGADMVNMKYNLLPFVQLCYLFLIFISSQRNANKEFKINTFDRITYFIIAILSFLMIFIAMTINETPLSEPAVIGIQGRYFLPFLPLLLISLRNSHITIRNKSNSYVLLSCFLLSVITLIEILASYPL